MFPVQTYWGEDIELFPSIYISTIIYFTSKFQKLIRKNTASKPVQSPGEVAVTWRKLQYHSNWHKNSSKIKAGLRPTHSSNKKFTCCIYKSSLLGLPTNLNSNVIVTHIKKTSQALTRPYTHTYNTDRLSIYNPLLLFQPEG